MPDKRLQKTRFLTKTDFNIYLDGYRYDFYSKEPNRSYFLHYHDYYEIIFYLGRGDLCYVLDGAEYQVKRNDIIFANIFKPHIFQCQDNTNFDRMSLGLDPAFLMNISIRNINYLNLFYEGLSCYPVYHPDSFQFLKYLEQINELHQFTGNEDRKALQEAIVVRLLAQLYTDCCVPSITDIRRSQSIQLISKLIDYINVNINRRLSLEELSEISSYSVSHICKVFKEETGETLTQYVQKKRIIMSKIMIENGTPITKVSGNLGFEDYSYFFKLFKKIEGCSPSEYKANKFQ